MKLFPKAENLINKNGDVLLIDTYSFRVLFLIASIAYLIFPFILKLGEPDAVDPIAGRMIIGGIIFIIYVLSFFVELIKKNIVVLGYILSYVLTFYYLYLMYLNELSMGYATGFLTIFLCVGVLFKTIQSLLLYFLISIAGVTAVCYFIHNSNLTAKVDPILFISILFTIAVITFLALASRIILMKSFTKKNKELKKSYTEINNKNTEIKKVNQELSKKREELEKSNKKLSETNNKLKRTVMKMI